VNNNTCARELCQEKFKPGSYFPLLRRLKTLLLMTWPVAMLFKHCSRLLLRWAWLLPCSNMKRASDAVFEA